MQKYGKYIGLWIYPVRYYSRIFVSIIAILFTAVASLLAFGKVNLTKRTYTLTALHPISIIPIVVFVLVFIYFGVFKFFPIRERTKGSKIIAAKLYENYYLGYHTPFGAPEVKINLQKKPTLLLLKLRYFKFGPTFRSTIEPWAGWQLLFLDNEPIWGPNIAALKFYPKEHYFFYQIIHRARVLGCSVKYAVIDPQYLEVFLDKMKSLLLETTPEKALNHLALRGDGTMNIDLAKYTPPPAHLEMPHIPPTYEEIYENILVR